MPNGAAHLKRAFDIIVALVVSVLVSPIALVIVLWMVLRRDMPVLYVSERMKTVDQSFQLYKFRTMHPPKPGEYNDGVSGGDKASRISPLGRILRPYRLDEIPQLLNILRGDMSLVGPRPPVRRYTESHREVYTEVLKSKPGVTGLASMVFYQHEERLLKATTSPDETDTVYKRRCIPRKAKIDLIYQRNRSMCYDVLIMWKTLGKVLTRD
ncbi:MAG: sugar transferase [Paracoccaceae bacterium]